MHKPESLRHVAHFWFVLGTSPGFVNSILFVRGRNLIFINYFPSTASSDLTGESVSLAAILDNLVDRLQSIGDGR
jgi:hypothetical protein